ncbi:HupE/UreJ family protein [Roseomonas fluvialis]|uniref:Urease accessory protein n=1 Tax=Roseomonas fluvialis TaxID=1750527 RepID=A0ABM9C6I0_9PROT|nr:HupE/UreJ family protein [Roseomonas fluvialis]BDG72563.1 urease accessory protein [Roseomonas fluvialis]
MTIPWSRAFAPVLFLLAAGPAIAHAGAANGLGSGLAHPLLGLDHLIAMLAIGFWSSQVGLARAWLLPGTFLGGLVVGILLGLLITPPGGTELLVSGSVVLLGVAVGIGGPRRVELAFPLAAAIGLIHGFAHGAEIGDSVVLTIIGMLVGSALLLTIGYVGGRWLGKRDSLVQTGGAGVIAAGLVLFLMA